MASETEPSLHKAHLLVQYPLSISKMLPKYIDTPDYDKTLTTEKENGKMVYLERMCVPRREKVLS